MAFPATRLPVTVEIAPGADPAADPGTWTWTDITSSVRLRDQIHIAVGRADESARVSPGTCRLRLDNRTGNFTPRNPLGTWYGTLGRNTPLRVRLQWAKDTFTRTVSNGWGTSESGHVWTVVGTASDYSTNGTQGLQSLGSVNVRRESRMSLTLATIDITVDSIGVSAAPTGADIEQGVRARISGADFVEARLIRLPAGGTLINIRQFVGGETVSGFVTVPGVANNSTISLRFQAIGATLRARAWLTGSAEPSTWQVTLTATLLVAGEAELWSMLMPGNTNTLPLVTSYDNFIVTNDRLSGFVSAWPPRWDKSGKDATVPIEANGVLRRLGQGTPPARSPMQRTIGASNPVAYWPCEDGSVATWAASALPGHNPLTIDGTATFRPQSDYDRAFPEIVHGTAALIDLSAGASLTASVPGSATTATATGWTAYVATDVDLATLSGNLVLFDVQTPGGTYARWQMRITVPDFHTKVVAITSAGVETTVIDDASGVSTIFVGFTLSVWQNGGNISVGINWNSTFSVFGASGSIAGTLAGVTGIGVNATKVTQTPALPVGHLALWATHPVPLDLRPAELSYSFPAGAITEAAHTRLARLCAEEGMALTIPAVTAGFETLMGVQPVAAFLDLLQECADADAGVLYESGFGLGFLPREHRYNRPVSLALDTAAGQIADPPEPTDDDQQLRNRWEVSRRDGSSGIAEDANSITALGLYDDSITVSHADDTALADHAAWRVHLGTVDEMRWPRIDLNLAAAPELIDAWLACGIGSRVTAIHPPPEVAGDDIDVIIEGYSEVLGYKDWDVSLNCSPASPWTVATADGAPRVSADGSTLGASLTSSALSFSLASTAANGVWTTDAADFPMLVNVGGEEIRLSAISGTTSPQTATVDTGGRSVNGVIKAHASGAPVDVWLPAIVAL